MAALIDQTVLNSFTMGDAVLQKELFDTYFEQSRFYMDQLRQAADDQSEKIWKDALHGLKGAARALGFLEILRIIDVLEQKAPSRNGLVQIEKALDKTYDAVQEFLR